MIFIVALILEVMVLTVIEYFTWNTLFTPLTCLMLPYTFILFLTIIAEGMDLGFVPFNYESIFIWNIGLIFFAIPSYTIGTVMRTTSVDIHRVPDVLPISKFQVIVAIVLSLAFIWKLKSTLASSPAMFGTDEFAEEFAGTGVWAHMREVLMCLLIMFIYYLDKKHWWLIIPIFLMLTIQFLYMVKGAIIIAVSAGYLLRLYSGKSHLNLKVALSVIGAAFAIFILVYMVIPLLGNDHGEANMQLLEFVFGHFMHYLTSGTLGWSYDLDTGLKDQGNISVILSPFINLFNTATGSKEPLINVVNPLYFNTGITLTNVRTFFGTLFIYTTYGQFVLYIMIHSSLLYLLKAIALISGNIYAYFIMFYYCGLLAMGWFEFYFFHLSIIEVPVLILLFGGVTWLGKFLPKYNIVQLRRVEK